MTNKISVTNSLFFRNFLKLFFLIFLIHSSFFAKSQCCAVPGWQWYVPVDIDNTYTGNAAHTNYQVLIIVDTQTLITAGKMLSTGDDIRFTDNNCGAFLNYYIEPAGTGSGGGINSTTTYIWVLLPTLPANAITTLKMYYGNPAAVAASSFATTFPNVLNATTGTLGGVQTYDWINVPVGVTLTLPVGQILTLDARKIVLDGTILGDGKGYAGNSGPGQGTQTGSSGGGGGGYGGLGGNGNGTGTEGPIYGTTNGPDIDMGSGGGNGQDCTNPGDGGGAVKMTACVIALNGSISLKGTVGGNGNSGEACGGGSGGGCLLQGDYISGSASINVSGGNGGDGTFDIPIFGSQKEGGGGGAGGRVKYFYCKSNTFSGTVTKNGGLPGSGPGSTTAGGLGEEGTATIPCMSYTIGVESPVSSFSVATTTTASGCASPNGTATATPSGGTPNYTYSWNTSPVQSSATATGLAAGIYSVTITDASGCSNTTTVNITGTSQPSVTATATPQSGCAAPNGTATATGTGGAGTYTYVWNTTPAQSSAIATGLSAGFFTVTVTDAGGCTNTTTVNITATVVQPSVTVASTQTGCSASNGTATATGNGGTPGYTYVWNTSPAQSSSVATGLAVGNYSVILTDSGGCTATETVSITSANAPTVSVPTSTPTSCGSPTGSATASASGGTGTLTYSWSPGGQTTPSAVGLASGSYVVTVTDALGCSVISQPVTVSVANGPTVTVTSLAATCGASDGSATAAVSGGVPGYTYSWSPSGQNSSVATALSAGTYSVTVTDASGCAQTVTVNVTQPSTPIVTVNASPSTISAGGSAQLTATGGGTYLWSPAAGLSCTACPNPTASPAATTDYCVVVTDASGCTDDDCITVEITTCGGIYLPNAFSPNDDGENDILYVYGNCISDLELKIYDRWGEKVFETNDPKQGWDGTRKGLFSSSAKQETSVFAYQLKATLTSGEKISKKGNVSLLR